MRAVAWEKWGRTGERATGDGSLGELLLEVPLEFPDSGGWRTHQHAQIGDFSGTPPLVSPQAFICRGFMQRKTPSLPMLRGKDEDRDGGAAISSSQRFQGGWGRARNL